MDTIELKHGVRVVLPRAGETLVVINHPGMDWAAPGQATAGSGEFVLVGFDRTPALGAYDASVPPFTVAKVPVPANCRQVYLLWPSDPAASPMLVPGSILVQLGWTTTAESPSVEFLSLLPVAAVTQPFVPYQDLRGTAFSPGAFASVLDNGLATGRGALRPSLAPSRSITASLALVAGTLTDIPNLGGFTGTPNQRSAVLLALCMSVTAAGLLVVGTSALTIGSPGQFEVVRRRAAAAGPLPDLNLPNGLDLAFDAHGPAVWRCYADAALTLDLTAILG